MRVPDRTADRLRRAGIEVRILRAGTAVEAFSRLRQEHGRVAAALHLTC